MSGECQQIRATATAVEPEPTVIVRMEEGERLSAGVVGRPVGDVPGRDGASG
jgi:hypothetical protein